MLQVYQQCYRVLKPQGLMILVTKNFIRNKKVIRLDLDTIKLCEQAGFTFVHRRHHKLPSQSFWRIIYYQKYPDVPVIDKEDILVFRKKSNGKSER
jgi:DNA modification methylase